MTFKNMRKVYVLRCDVLIGQKSMHYSRFCVQLIFFVAISRKKLFNTQSSLKALFASCFGGIVSARHNYSR